MKLKRLLFYYCITAVIVIGDNHETNVVGKVLTTGDAIPLQGANVTFVNAYNEYGSTTDEMGVYAISNIAPGKYSITVSFIGFEDYEENILIEAGKLYNIDAELVIQPIVMARLEIISDSSVPYKKLPGSATVLDMETIKLVNPIGTQFNDKYWYKRFKSAQKFTSSYFGRWYSYTASLICVSQYVL